MKKTKGDLISEIEGYWMALNYTPQHKEASAKLWCNASPNKLHNASFNKLASYKRYLQVKWQVTKKWGKWLGIKELEAEMEDAKADSRMEDYHLLWEAKNWQLRGKQLKAGEPKAEAVKTSPSPSGLGEVNWGI